jgi:hypothetical protein
MDVKTESFILPNGNSILLRTALMDEDGDSIAELTHKVIKQEDEAIRAALVKLGWTPPGEVPVQRELENDNASLRHENAELRHRFAPLLNAATLVWDKTTGGSRYLVNDATSEVLCWLNTAGTFWKDRKGGRYFANLELAKLTLECEELDRLAALARLREMRRDGKY